MVPTTEGSPPTADVRGGAIPMARIDDAVSRIVRAKLRGGLFDGSPATDPSARIGDRDARRAPRPRGGESAGAAQNERRALPL
jgi:beta-glucosidase